MTQKMTAAEALATVYNIRNDYGPWQWDVYVDRLRALGFVIIPIEPDDAAIERMATAINETFRFCGAVRPCARAAYAAIVTAPSSEK